VRVPVAWLKAYCDPGLTPAQVAHELAMSGTEAERIDPHVERLVTLLAVPAGVAVERSLREDNLRAALQTRKLIGQAVGLVMERFGLDAELAFRYLVRLSSNSNVKLREVAGELVGEANIRA